MSSVERGRGSPVVLIPGIQGRWEWMGPTLEALSRRHRVLTFSLGDATGPSPFDRWVDLIDRLLDRAGEPAATVVGVSFGGLVASRYAARRRSRVRALVLAAAPSPRMCVDPRIKGAIRHPWIALPAFVLGSVGRLSPEIVAARDTWRSRASFSAGYALRALRSPVSPTDMAAWVRAWLDTDISVDCRTIAAPTLVITGERELDRVVPVASTREYLDLIPGARHVTLPRTGHLGFVTRPREFASLVDTFIDASSRASVVAPALAG